jgi:hypothetical protein
MIPSYHGSREARNLRPVDRAAIYDPHQDLAYKRVVDLNPNAFMVEKSPWWHAKFKRDGRWKPRHSS